MRMLRQLVGGTREGESTGAAGSAAGGGGKSATAAAAAQAKTLRKETNDLMGDAMAGIESTQI